MQSTKTAERLMELICGNLPLHSSSLKHCWAQSTSLGSSHGVALHARFYMGTACHGIWSGFRRDTKHQMETGKSQALGSVSRVLTDSGLSSPVGMEWQMIRERMFCCCPPRDWQLLVLLLRQMPGHEVITPAALCLPLVAVPGCRACSMKIHAFTFGQLLWARNAGA